MIAHEAAHSNARHHTELQSKAIATSIWVGALTGIFAGTKYEAINNLFIITGSLMVPKFSRDNEYEADKLALIYMARAGYDPNEAIRLWEKAASRYDKNNKTNAFASHPPEWRRAERLKKHLPEAIAYYEDAKRGVTPATYTLHASMRSGSYVVESNTCSIALNNLKVESEKDYHAAKMASLRTDMQSQSKKSLKAEIQKEYVLLKRDVPSPTRFVMRDADSQEVKLFVTVKSDGSLIATDNRSKPKYICEGRLADGKRGNMGVLKCEDASPDTTAKHIVPMPAKGKQSRASGPSYSCRITLVGH